MTQRLAFPQSYGATLPLFFLRLIASTAPDSSSSSLPLCPGRPAMYSQPSCTLGLLGRPSSNCFGARPGAPRAPRTPRAPRGLTSQPLARPLVLADSLRAPSFSSYSVPLRQRGQLGRSSRTRQVGYYLCKADRQPSKGSLGFGIPGLCKQSPTAGPEARH